MDTPLSRICETGTQASKPNTLLNVVPAGELHVVERARQFHGVRGPGWFLAVPGLDRVAAVVPTREQSVSVPSETLATRDGGGVDADAKALYEFVDAGAGTKRRGAFKRCPARSSGRLAAPPRGYDVDIPRAA